MNNTRIAKLNEAITKKTPEFQKTAAEEGKVIHLIQIYDRNNGKVDSSGSKVDLKIIKEELQKRLNSGKLDHNDEVNVKAFLYRIDQADKDAAQLKADQDKAQLKADQDAQNAAQLKADQDAQNAAQRQAAQRKADQDVQNAQDAAQRQRQADQDAQNAAQRQRQADKRKADQDAQSARLKEDQEEKIKSNIEKVKKVLEQQQQQAQEAPALKAFDEFKPTDQQLKDVNNNEFAAFWKDSPQKAANYLVAQAEDYSLRTVSNRASTDELSTLVERLKYVDSKYDSQNKPETKGAKEVSAETVKLVQEKLLSIEGILKGRGDVYDTSLQKNKVNVANSNAIDSFADGLADGPSGEKNNNDPTPSFNNIFSDETGNPSRAFRGYKEYIRWIREDWILRS